MAVIKLDPDFSNQTRPLPRVYNPWELPFECTPEEKSPAYDGMGRAGDQLLMSAGKHRLPPPCFAKEISTRRPS